MVSFSEYPTIVRMAAMTGKFISLFVNEKTPKVIKTSWANVMRADTP